MTLRVLTGQFNSKSNKSFEKLCISYVLSQKHMLFYSLVLDALVFEIFSKTAVFVANEQPACIPLYCLPRNNFGHMQKVNAQVRLHNCADKFYIPLSKYIPWCSLYVFSMPFPM